MYFKEKICFQTILIFETQILETITDFQRIFIIFEVVNISDFDICFYKLRGQQVSKVKKNIFPRLYLEEISYTLYRLSILLNQFCTSGSN